jgi:hypothetical protein
MQPFKVFDETAKVIPEFCFGGLAVEDVPDLLRRVLEFEPDLLKEFGRNPLAIRAQKCRPATGRVFEDDGVKDQANRVPPAERELLTRRERVMAMASRALEEGDLVAKRLKLAQWYRFAPKAILAGHWRLKIGIAAVLKLGMGSSGCSACSCEPWHRARPRLKAAATDCSLLTDLNGATRPSVAEVSMNQTSASGLT